MRMFAHELILLTILSSDERTAHGGLLYDHRRVGVLALLFVSYL